MDDLYNRNICPLQACRHLTLKLFIQGQTRIAKLKNAYNLLIPVARGLQCQANL